MLATDRDVRRVNLLAVPVILLLALGNALGEARAEGNAPAAINAQLRAAVSGAISQLGTLDPSQKKIFEEEIVPNHQRFIRDYRPSEKGVSVEVDLESMKNYLYFSASKSLQGQDSRGLLFVWAEPECAKCTAAANDIRQLLKSRIEHRGLKPVWLSVQDVGDPKNLTKPMGDKLTELIKARGAGAAVAMVLKGVPVEELDAAHADEAHYRIQSWLQVGPMSRHEGTLELISTEDFEPAGLRLLTDALTEVGAKLALAEQFGGTTRGEILVEATGVQDYAQAQRLKAKLLGTLKDAQNIEERKISKGKVVFAVTTSKSSDDVKRSIASVGKWDVPAPAPSVMPPPEATASTPLAALVPQAAEEPSEPLHLEVK